MAKKQMEIPGTERPVIKEIERAAEKYVSIRDERMELTEKEVEARTKLIDVMHENNLTVYVYDDKVVEVQPSEKVKVKKRMDDAPEESEEEE